ncbi:hypothetical protein A2706_00135 [Candidatus Peribacteria bacterium RIFCSPHIGHO2_01_FULL_51_35]|nr:MAG: hypothetical protein A2706_00135 [Candidatus Peribacteria bacterium RIFCSPHIGHO2_01_FULL_51_35]
MSTSKKRLNITLPKDVRLYIQKLAVRDQMPEATKAAQLLQMALEIEEDAYFAKVADMRVSKKARFISHDKFWAKVL